MDEFIKNVTSAGIDAIVRSYEQHVAGYCPPNPVWHEGDRQLNRYRDVLCLESTRVKLALNVPPETDYINANWIRLDGMDRPFVATQGPLVNTAADFWRMVFKVGEDCSPTILMLCQCVEDNVNKCFQYWPVKEGEFKDYGCMHIVNKKTEITERYSVFTLEVLPENCSNSVFTTLYQTKDWPDRGVPKSPMSLLRLLRTIRMNKLASGPCIVHCSAGLGRTGTVIAIEACLQLLFKNIAPNVREIVKKMRDQRPNLVKTKGQYVFIYAALLYYINAKTGKYTEEVLKFHDSIVTSGLV